MFVCVSERERERERKREKVYRGQYPELSSNPKITALL